MAAAVRTVPTCCHQCLAGPDLRMVERVDGPPRRAP